MDALLIHRIFEDFGHLFENLHLLKTLVPINLIYPNTLGKDIDLVFKLKFQVFYILRT